MAKIGISSPTPGSVCVCVNIVMCHLSYCELTKIENVFQAWNEFRRGKSKRFDVQKFEKDLENNLFSLYERLGNKTYKHQSYESFYVQDPKQRLIHKAKVCDRIVHHLLYKFLYKLFDPCFITTHIHAELGKVHTRE